jgi:hypothetical protein
LKGAKPAELPVEQPGKRRAGDQPEDRKGARHHDSKGCSAARGRSHSVIERSWLVAVLALLAAVAG